MEGPPENPQWNKNESQEKNWQFKNLNDLNKNQKQRQLNYLKLCFNSVPRFTTIGRRNQRKNRNSSRSGRAQRGRKREQREDRSRSRSPRSKSRTPPLPMLGDNDQRIQQDMQRNHVTPLFKKLETMGTHQPTFLETFYQNKKIPNLNCEDRNLKRKKLYKKLKELNKLSNKFFQKQNKKFLERLTISNNFHSPGTTVKWTQPNGLLRSFQAPEWNFLADFSNGENIYPLNFCSPEQNIFVKEKFEKSYLLNPPFTDYEKPFTKNETQPLRNHIRKIYNLAISSHKPQLVMFPWYPNEMPEWFLDYTINPFVTPLFFNTPLTFLRGRKLELVGVAKFKIVILAIGIYSPANIQIRNNTLGNFSLKPKLMTTLKNMVHKPNITSFSHFLPSFFSNHLSFQKECHKTWEKAAITFKKTGMDQDFENFQMPTRKVHQNQLTYFQQNTQHSFYTDRMLKVPKGEKKIIFNRQNPLQFNQQYQGSQKGCAWCGQTSHSFEHCIVRPLNNTICPSTKDLPTMKFIDKQKPLIIKQPGQEPPTSKQLNSYLNKIITYANDLKEKAPKADYFDNVTFATLRNNWHTSLALGNPTHLAKIFFAGYILPTRLGPRDYPNCEIRNPSQTPQTKEKIWKHTLKLLEKNKIWACQREKIHTIAPVFLLEGFNSVGDWKERLIHDFSWFKNHFPSYTYRLPIPQEVRTKMEQYICITIDIKSAFHHALLKYSNLVGFYAENPSTGQDCYFASASPLFGMQASPYICYTFLKFIANFFQNLNFPTLCYVDDFVIGIAKISENLSEAQIQERAEFAKTIFTIGGLKISPKIEIIPTTFIQYIGKFYSTIHSAVLPNIIKLPFLYEQINQALQKERVTIQLLDSLRGKLAYHGNYDNNFYSNNFNAILAQERKKLNGEQLTKKQLYKKLYQIQIPVDDTILLMLKKFVQIISDTYVNQEQKNLPQGWDALISVDASIHLGGSLLIFPEGELHTHTFDLYPELDLVEEPSSTVRELTAIQKALMIYTPILSSRKGVKNIVVLNDNKVNVQHINTQNPKQPELKNLYLNFHCLQKNLPFNFEFIWLPREDLLSRVVDQFSKKTKPVVQSTKLLQKVKRQIRKRLKRRNFVVISDPDVIRNITLKNLHKLPRKSWEEKTLIILLPPFIEFQFVYQFFLCLKTTKQQFWVSIFPYRKSTFLKIIRDFFPRIKVTKTEILDTHHYEYQKKMFANYTVTNC